MNKSVNKRLFGIVFVMSSMLGVGILACSLVHNVPIMSALAPTPTSPSMASPLEISPSAPSASQFVPSDPPNIQETSDVPDIVPGRIFYVDGGYPGASDDYSGLFLEYRDGNDGPWRSIRRAAQAMQAGDTTYVRGGVYNEAGIIFANSGALGQPITLASYKDEEVILDGSDIGVELPGIAIFEGQGHYVIQGLTIRNMSWSGIATDESAKIPFEDISILDCVVHGNAWSGIDLAGVNGFRVVNVDVFDNGYYGLNILSANNGKISSANGEVSTSKFYNHRGAEGHGLAINQGHNIVVRDSIAYHNTIHGFDVSDWPKYGELSHNVSFDGNLSYDNGDAGFAVNSDSHHVIYRNNVAWRNGADWAGRGTSSGFLCYEGCWHVEYYNNTAVENSDAGFAVTDHFGLYSQPEDSLLIYRNNIAHDNGRPEWDVRLGLMVEGVSWQVIAEHNNWSGPQDEEAPIVGINLVGEQGETYSVAQLNAGGFQVGNLSVKPLFVDAAVGDFRLSSGSPMIDAGVIVGLPFCGLAPDLGAEELCP